MQVHHMKRVGTKAFLRYLSELRHPRMIWIQLICLLVLLLVSSVGPGLLLVRRVRWKPGETLCASIALSWFLIYLACLLIFIFHLPPTLHWGISIACLAMTLLCAR